jgi:hypothetical protein
MEATAMLDVLHYFFEDDLNYSTSEQAEARDNMRSALYTQLYGEDYKYSSGVSPSAEGGVRANFDLEEEIRPVDLKDRKTDSFNPAMPPKPYVRPTPVNLNAARPFGNVIDAPLG